MHPASTTLISVRKSFVMHSDKTKEGREMYTMYISDASEPGAGREATLHCSPMQPRRRICVGCQYKF